MKKIIYILAAMVVLAACGKENPAEESGTDTSSNKGRMVTISVSAPEGSTKVVGTDNGESFSFKWEEGDKILVKDNWGIADSQVFTLVTGAGTNSATFTGTLPEIYDGDSYDIQYPTSDPDLNNQTYEAGKIAKGLMRFYKSGITLDKDGKCNVTLDAKYAILQLNLYGLARSVKKIEVRDVESSGVNSTLTCSTPVTVGKDSAHATPFYIVYKGGVNPVRLRIDVDMNEGTPKTSDLADYESYGKGTPISCKTFVQGSKHMISDGTCVNMPAISLTTIWAPVNCGYDPANFKYGKLYQWGRKDGSGYIAYDGKSQYDDAGGILQTCPNPGSITSQIAASEENSNYYYNTTYIVYDGKDSVSYNTDWLATKDNYRWDATGGSDAVHFAKKGVHDPCPEGWRLPTKTEMATLMGGNTSTDEFPISTHGSTTGIAGRWFNGSTETTPTSGVFLPVVGYRNSLNTAACAYRQTVWATYWTSSVSGDRACSMGFSSSSKPSISPNSNRAGGCAVRCVQE